MYRLLLRLSEKQLQILIAVFIASIFTLVVWYCVAQIRNAEHSSKPLYIPIILEHKHSI